MFSATSIFLCVTLLNSGVHVQGAVESSTADHDDFAATEWTIRNTLHNLFSTLKNKDMHQKLKLKQYTTIHNFFVSITLQDHDNLKEIARLTKVDNFDNGTRVFITQLNEVLDEDNKSDEETDAVYVTSLIDDFLTKLDHLKETHGLKNNTKFFDINKAIIKYFEKNENCNEVDNTTYTQKENRTRDNTTSLEVWDPLQLNELQSGRRIFGGHEAKIERFPFMASVQFFKKFQCAGSIIKSDVVVTSASCLQLAWNNRFFNENPAFLSLQVGSTFNEHGGENIPVLEIHFHPNYEPKTLGNNLALLRMVRALAFGKRKKKIKRIEIDTNPWPLPSNTDGITIVGWGAKGLNNHIIEQARKNRLTYAVLDFYPYAECQEIYSREFVTRHNFCAGFFSKGGGACNRDAGGPGVASGILVGVVSFGSPSCGAPDAPTVFTKLGYYNDWIEQVTEQDVASGRVYTTSLPPKRLTTLHLPATYVHITANLNITPINEDSDQPPEVAAKGSKNAIRTGREDFTEFIETIFDSEELTDISSYDLESDSEEDTGLDIQVKKKKNKKKKKITKKKSKRKSERKIIKSAKIKDHDRGKLSTTKTKAVKRPLRQRPAIVRTTSAPNKIQKTRVTKKLVKEYDIFASEEMITSSHMQPKSKTRSDDSYGGDSDNDKENLDVYSDDDDDDNNYESQESSEDQQKVEEVIEGLVDNIKLNEILGSGESLLDDSEREIAKLIKTNDKHKKNKLVDKNPYLVDITKKRVDNSNLENKDQSETNDYDTSYENDGEDDSENDSNAEQGISLDYTYLNSNNKKKIPDEVDNKDIKNIDKHVKGKKKKKTIAIQEKEGDLTMKKKIHKILSKGKVDESTNKYEEDEGKRRDNHVIAKYLEDLRARVVKNKEDEFNKKDVHKKGILKKQKHQDKNIDDETIHAKEKQKQTNENVDDENSIVNQLKTQLYMKNIEHIIKKKKNLMASKGAVNQDSKTKDKKKQFVSTNSKIDIDEDYENVSINKRNKNLMMDKIQELMKSKTTATYSSDNTDEEYNNSDVKKKKKLASDSEIRQYKEDSPVNKKKELELQPKNKDDTENKSDDNVEDSNDSTDIVTKNIKKDSKKVKLDEDDDDDDDNDGGNSNDESVEEKVANEMKKKKNISKGNRNITENLFNIIVGSGDIYKLLLGNTG
ncbi:unnamed protein product [Spodoptera littoralis]|uniref:Peptidase S1 domain-containing protein n=1 Tax=Spodoptera littoralis TaxID=7109 RepID=A0A9P0I6X0_SPOLI|nr:unnamed protein product [Spodoptera littoralis]CAH1640525.1 unnamed protein product [Spodoptera littoralis]